MSGHRTSYPFRKSRTLAWVPVVICAALLVVPALAQDSTQAPSAPGAQDGDPPESSTAAPGFRPGLVHELGRWLEEGAAKLKTGIRDARDRLDQLGSDSRDAAKEAAAAVPSLPTSVTARERCLAAPNGAPDCQAAAETLCRGKGFRSGRSLDTQTEQKCSARVLLSGRSPNNHCSTEIFVTRAICQ
jgi:hypothetical protein